MPTVVFCQDPSDDVRLQVDAGSCGSTAKSLGALLAHMTSDNVQIIAGYVALAVPITVGLTSMSKIVLEWLNQRHSVRTSHIAQEHQITTHYLDRALDPNVSLAIRHQLLRFLATPDKGGSRLNAWAVLELKRVGGVVDEVNRAVGEAEKAVQEAKTNAQLQSAERKLAEAVRRQRSLLDAPTKPEVSAAAIRAGFIDDKKLNGLVLTDEDLSGAQLLYRELRGADFSHGEVVGTNFQGSDLRAASFRACDLQRANFYQADTRGADFSESLLSTASFHGARLEGANLTGAQLDDCDLRATYDSTTRWPTDFDPKMSGAVSIDAADGKSVLEEDVFVVKGA